MSLSTDQFTRLRRLPPYVFAEVNSLKQAERAAGQDIIDFGMGNPDLPTPAPVVEKLRETALDPKTHGYSMSRGIPGLRKAQAGYYERRFGVALDPEHEIVVSLGSKEGLANLSHAITEPGDTIVVANPSYPIHPYGFIIADAAVRYIPKPSGGYEPDEDFIASFKRALKHTQPAPKAVILNYPNNPTAEVVPLAFFEEMVSICQHYGIYILSDIAYGEVYFDEPPPSILQVKGAMEIAVEFSSMSKTYSMAGWRVGFACGNRTLIAALARIKSYVDYGAFTPIQVAAAYALNGPQDCVDTMRATYKERRDVLVQGLHEIGWQVPVPKASMFIWAPIPEPYREMGSLAFSKELLTQAQVAVSPGIGFGEYGDGHVRIAMVENTQRIRQALRNLRRYFGANLQQHAVLKEENRAGAA